MLLFVCRNLRCRVVVSGLGLTRRSHITLLKGSDGWVTIKENKLKYSLDITRCVRTRDLGLTGDVLRTTAGVTAVRCCWVAPTFVSLVCGSVMFSSGNVTEKARVAAFPAKDDVVVDMFAGIGYFTVHSLDAVDGSCTRRPSPTHTCLLFAGCPVVAGS